MKSSEERLQRLLDRQQRLSEQLEQQEAAKDKLADTLKKLGR